MAGQDPIVGPLEQGSLEGVDIHNQINRQQPQHDNRDLNDSGVQNFNLNQTNNHFGDGMFQESFVDSNIA